MGYYPTGERKKSLKRTQKTPKKQQKKKTQQEMKNLEIQAKNLYRSVLEDHLTNIGPTNIGPVGPLITPLEIKQTVLTS